VALEREGDSWVAKQGSGGLVTALAPVLSRRRGVWIGWPGTTGRADVEGALNRASDGTGYSLSPVMLTREEIDDYYYGFSNEIIWPLFHGFETRCRFRPAYWKRYLEVNEKFARSVKEHGLANDYVWVQDYHLMLVGHFLKSLGTNRHTGFFLHIPFPPVDTFMKLPWRSQLLEALLDYELLGFQTARDRRNFIRALNEVHDQEIRVRGRGTTISVSAGDGARRAGVFPISIDYGDFAGRAESETVSAKARHIRDSLGARHVVLGVDRLDYTKGIPERLEAFATLLRKHPGLRGKTVLVQVVVPSRQDVSEYRSLRSEIEQLVGKINGKYTSRGWVPVHFLYRSMERDELIAHYRAADIGLVTPLRDGMNLVAKEYCACSVEEDGVLVLSEFAGATAELQRGGLLVNPYDVEGTADALHDAVRMSTAERRQRMGRMRKTIRKRDIFRWTDSFLQTAFAGRLEDVPFGGESLPEYRISDYSDVLRR
jgi:trehalose 6-phosphate synthase